MVGQLPPTLVVQYVDGPGLGDRCEDLVVPCRKGIDLEAQGAAPAPALFDLAGRIGAGREGFDISDGCGAQPCDGGQVRPRLSKREVDRGGLDRRAIVGIPEEFADAGGQGPDAGLPGLDEGGCAPAEVPVCSDRPSDVLAESFVSGPS